ncbi:MAG: hypothetical protein H6Q04_197 [Acidobacteria bacterium]|nr:hypothetical protein [Acidobacteriota bacterium]
MESALGIVGLFGAGVVAGAINSVAGGGSLISFPALIAFGIPPIPANATNTAAVLPGSISSAAAYRKDLPGRHEGPFISLFLPSLAGGLLGAVVLAVTPSELFSRMVPFLILFATILFSGREYFARLVNARSDEPGPISRLARLWGFSFQLFVAAYGGYFGAGIGILMLASFSLMGMHDIHKMNAMKTFLASVINGTALFYFILRGLIVWPIAILMACGAIIGGYLGARLAKRVNQRILGLFIVAIGFAVSVWLFLRL